MKILLICDYDGITYGAERQMFGLRTQLREMGHDARILTSKVMFQETISHADYKVFGTSHEKFQVVSQTLNVSSYLTLRRVLAEFEPDVIHVQMFLWQISPLIMPLLADYPAIYHPCVYKSVCPVGSKTLPDGSQCQVEAGLACLSNQCVTVQTWSFMMLQLKLFRRWQHVFDRVVAVSHTVREKLLEDGILCTDVIYNGVPESSYTFRLNDTPLIVFAGRLDKYKGVDVLLRAMSYVVDACCAVQLLIAGDGKDRRALELLTVELGLQNHVTFLGFLEKDTMDKKFQCAWAQVVPSIWAEPFGNVVTEAMMRGTVPIASNIGGMSEIIRDDIDGILVPPNDEVALSDAILRLIQSPEEIHQMSLCAYDFAQENYGEARFAQRIEKIYEEVINDFHA